MVRPALRRHRAAALIRRPARPTALDRRERDGAGSCAEILTMEIPPYAVTEHPRRSDAGPAPGWSRLRCRPRQPAT